MKCLFCFFVSYKCKPYVGCYRVCFSLNGQKNRIGGSQRMKNKQQMQNIASQFLSIGQNWRLRSSPHGWHAVVVPPARLWLMDSELGNGVVVQTIVASVQQLQQRVNGCVGGVCRLSTGCGRTASTWRSTSTSSTSLPSWGRRSAPSSPASTASPPWSPSTWGRNSRRTTWVARPTFAPRCGGFLPPTTLVLQAIRT